MGINYGGLATGIERGITLGLALDEHKQNKEDRIYTRGIQERKLALSEETNKRSIDTHELTMATNRLALQDAKDSLFRKKALDKINAGRYASMQFMQRLKANDFTSPDEFQSAYQQMKATQLDTINFVGRRMINQGNAPGETKAVSDIIPHAPSGQLMVQLDVTAQHGNQRQAPIPTTRS